MAKLAVGTVECGTLGQGRDHFINFGLKKRIWELCDVVRVVFIECLKGVFYNFICY